MGNHGYPPTLAHSSTYIERGIDPYFNQDTCGGLDNMVKWAPETGMGIHAGKAGGGIIIRRWLPGGQPEPSTLPTSSEALVNRRRWPGATVGGCEKAASFCGQHGRDFTGSCASLKGALGEFVKQKLPDTVLVERTGDTVRELHQDQGLSEDVLRGVIPPLGVSSALQLQSIQGKTAGENRPSQN